MIKFREGGWVLVLAVVAVLAIAAWRLPVILGSLDSRATGDGVDLASYGFDLTGAPDDLIAADMAKDLIRPLDEPLIWTMEQATSVDTGGHGAKPWLLPNDRVIGVVIDGEARAYPEDILEWHEVVHDTLGGVPIAVTYHPLSDAAVVLDRRHGHEVLSFGHSGLLWDSSQVLYDRRDAGESLWSPLMRRAIAGPAAGAGLTPVPAAFVRWEDWQALHPDSTVLGRDPTLKKRYKRMPYNSYRGNDLLQFPVEPLPPADDRPKKAPVIVLSAGGERVVAPVDVIYEHAGDGGRWAVELGGQTVELWTGRSPSVFVHLPEEDSDAWALHCSWFAWYARFPDDPVAE